MHDGRSTGCSLWRAKFKVTRRSTLTRGFTLVELLVVIAIIGILVALLLPAIQAAREAARRTQCRNHLKQMGLGAQNHLSVHKVFPSGGWGWRWAGDPNRGYLGQQPGGWMYNILPFVEEEQLHDMGKGTNVTAVNAGIAQAIQTPVTIYSCPSRRRADTSPYTHGSPYRNASPKPPLVARSDYVACAGFEQPRDVTEGPGSLAAGNGWTGWDKYLRGTGSVKPLNGITIPLGGIGVRKIPDGLTHTLLYGEKYLPADKYDNAPDDDQGWNLGFDIDVIRWSRLPPRQDTAGQSYNQECFGSYHSSASHFATADGAVVNISYDIADNVFKFLGGRNDKQTVAVP